MRGAIARDRILPRVFQVSERHMRRKFSSFKLKPGTPHSLLDFRLQMIKRRRHCCAHPKSTRVFIAKKAKSRQGQFKGRRFNLRERFDGAGESVPVGLANEGERQMKVLRRSPARALNTGLQC